MKLRIFILAFSFGFIICFSAAAVFILGFSAREEEIPAPEKEADEAFIMEEKAVFLLVYENEGEFGPFALVALDAVNGRIPVFSFSAKTVLDYGGEHIPAGRLFSSVSPEIFAGTVETEFGAELSGYFIWNRESAEKVISVTGTFDYVLPKDVRYFGKAGNVNLISGTQSMNGKKICDIIENPKITEDERCDYQSRIIASFLNRRLKRFFPESKIYSVLFNYTKTDITAFEKESCSRLAKLISSSGVNISGHITAKTEKDPATGFLFLTEETKERVSVFFGRE